MEKQIPHGTYSGYTNHGCRCDPCKAACSVYRKEHKEIRSKYPADKIPHGTLTGYTAYKCKCSPCRIASRDYMRNRRKDPEYNKKAEVYRKNWESRNPNHAREYRQKNLETLQQYDKERYWSDPERFRDKNKQYRKDNPEYFLNWNRTHRQNQRAAVKRWRKKNPHWVSEYRAKYKERFKEYTRKYRAKNPEKKKIWDYHSRSRRKNAKGFSTPEQIKARVAYYGWSCWMCGGPYEHLDHVVPLSAGGTNWPSNLRPACAPCNLRKNKKWPYIHND